MKIWKGKMKNKKITGLINLICIACLAFTSCVSAGKNFEPQYLIHAKNDNGFVSAYKAYFAIEGDSIRKISSRSFESLTLAEDSQYKVISPQVQSFDKGNPADESVLRDLEAMGIAYTDSLYVLVTTFDEYKIIQVTTLDGNVALDESYAMFRNGSPMQIPKDINLSCLFRFYRHK